LDEPVSETIVNSPDSVWNGKLTLSLSFAI
jgi:hypothetical protein